MRLPGIKPDANVELMHEARTGAALREWRFRVVGTTWRTVLAALFAAALVASCYKYTGFDVVGIDDSVYRTSVHAWWSDRDPYATEIEGNLAGTPFTYPPFALLVLSPVGWLSGVGAHNFMTSLTAACVVVVSFTVARATAYRDGVNSWWGFVAACVIVAGALRSGNAVLSALSLGQISVIVMTLCLVDVVLLRGTHASGVLVAMAAAIKVTPGLFILFLLAVDRRAGVRALGWAAAFTLIGALFLPLETWRYFTEYLWATDRVGDIVANSNVSITGVLARTDWGPAAQLWSWIVASVAMLGVSVMAVRRVWKVDSGVWAACTIGQVTCLISPLTWSHHAAWFSLAGALLLIHATFSIRRSLLVRAATVSLGAAIIYTLFFWALLWSVPGAPTRGLDGFLAQNVFFVVGLAGLAGLWIVSLGHPSEYTEKFRPAVVKIGG